MARERKARTGRRPRGVVAATAFICALFLVPHLLDDAWVAVLTLVLFFAFVGQAWNLMMGHVGLLSLGHGLFLGIGGYTAAVLLEGYGVTPWVGIPAGAVVAAAIAAAIAWLGFRFSVRGVYFALLTIAFAEFFRILFSNWPLIGGTGGYFLRVVPEDNVPLLSLRGGAEHFYYVFFVLFLLGLIASARLTRSRIGMFWSAIREDEEAARALGVKSFRLKVLAVAISAAMTACGGAAFALMNGSLFPNTLMGMQMSVQIILAPIIGGLGTLFGPFVGAVFVVLVLEFSRDLGQTAGVYGLSTLVYGLTVLGVVLYMPEGIWPRLVRLAGPLRRDR